MTPFTGHSQIDQTKGIVNWFVVSRDWGGKRLEHKGDRKIRGIMVMFCILITVVMIQLYAFSKLAGLHTKNGKFYSM